MVKKCRVGMGGLETVKLGFVIAKANWVSKLTLAIILDDGKRIRNGVMEN